MYLIIYLQRHRNGSGKKGQASFWKGPDRGVGILSKMARRKRSFWHFKHTLFPLNLLIIFGFHVKNSAFSKCVTTQNDCSDS